MVVSDIPAPGSGSQLTGADYRLCAALPTEAMWATNVILTCDPPVTGRYVTVYRPASGVLEICEVEVYSNAVNSMCVFIWACATKTHP